MRGGRQHRAETGRARGWGLGLATEPGSVCDGCSSGRGSWTDSDPEA